MVTVSDGNGAVNAAGMQFASDGYVVQGDAINLVGSAGDPAHSIIRVGDGAAAGTGYKATVNSVLEGNSALVKTDAGTLVLGGANTYTGGTTISGGTLQIGNGGTSGSITGDVADNASLVFNRGDHVAFNGTVSGNGSLIQAGSGTLMLVGNSTYTGGTKINSGTLQLGNGGTAGSIVGDVANNGSLVFNRSDDATFNGIVSGSGSLTQASTATLTLTGNSTYIGGTTINSGTLQLGNGGAAGAIAGDVTNNGSLVFDRSDDFTFIDIVRGTGSLEQAGTGSLIIMANSTYTGGTKISNGTLQLGDGGTTGSITGSVANNASLVFDRADNVTFNGVVSGSGSLEQVGTGSLILTGANTYSGGTAVKGGTLEIASGAALGSGSVSVGDDNGSYLSNYILQVDNGASLFNHVVLAGYGTLDNAGAVGGNVDIAVEGADYISGYVTVSNHDGGSIEGNNVGVMLSGFPSTVKNSSGGLIQGGNVGIGLTYGGMVTNDGNGSTIGSSGGVAVQSSFGNGTVQNTGGGTITGGTAAVDFHAGGTVTNAGVGSVISSPGVLQSER